MQAGEGVAMIELRAVLCPIDFSEFSRRALDHAAALAKAYEGTVTVLHVTPATLPPLSGLASVTADTLEPEVRQKLRNDLLERLKTFAASAAAMVRVDAHVEEGQNAAQIVALARSLPADLLVMGTHGHGGFEKLILGSTTAKTLLTAPCPVLTIPPAPEATVAPGLFRRILWAADFSPSADRALACALSLAGKADGRITPLHVLEGLPGPRGAAALAAFDVASYRRGLEADAREQLRERLPEDAARWCEEAEVRAGKPYEEILSAAERLEADLIVMGVQGHGAVADALFGSTAYQVARRASCPVLTARAAAGETA
jgi:nucleotide-binding universal stress UspA family protein